MRYRGTNTRGQQFSTETIASVWNKARIIPGYDSSTYRMDGCGAVIVYAQYGDTSSDYGWEIDHIVPVSQGGSDNLSNLQPLQWQNNRFKSDNWPNWSCAVSV